MKFRVALALAAALGAVAIAHPHFQKTIEMHLGKGEGAPNIKLEHITVPFDKPLADKMKEGDAWHMGNSSLETTADVKIGGKSVLKGKYRLLTRKMKSGDWELVLDPGGKPYNNEITDKAMALETKFEKGQPNQEHLRLDLQPSGDAAKTVLSLEAHFGEYKATSKIEVPEAAPAPAKN